MQKIGWKQKGKKVDHGEPSWWQFQRSLRASVLFMLVLCLCWGMNLPVQSVEEGVILHIDRKQNIMTLFLNEVPVYRFQVATGRRGHATPIGQFRIITKLYNPYYVPKGIPGGSPKNPLGTRWLGLNVPGTGGYKYGIHGTNRNELLGSNVSAGCVRMRNADVEFLYRHLPIGTKVIIE